ncbi:hypothetical protein FHR51_001267 [Xanthomonas arboricola]|nr:hypothetical protein [Xanthomonas cannabis]
MRAALPACLPGSPASVSGPEVEQETPTLLQSKQQQR